MIFFHLFLSLLFYSTLRELFNCDLCSSPSFLAAASAAVTRDAYTWDSNTNAFVPKPVVISAQSPCLNAGFFNTSRPAILPLVMSSQCRQDLNVFQVLGNKERGFFVDLAAHDWLRLSNTYALEHHAGWTGLCIEPIPDYTIGILENRRCRLITNPVYSTSNHHVTFKSDTYRSGIIDKDMDNQDAGKSIVHSFITVTLINILRSFNAPFVIDYLSLDIEGAEFHALKHFDFGMYTFLVMTIERPSHELHVLLTKHNYWFATILKDKNWASFGECLYLHTSNPNFKQSMQQFRVVDAKEIDVNWYGANHSYILEPAYPPIAN